MSRFRMSGNTWGLTLVLVWIAWLASPFLYSVADRVVNPEPWFEATISVRLDEDEVKVDYGRTVRRSLGGTWFAWIDLYEEDRRPVWQPRCGGSGQATYHPEESGVSTMSLSFFTGDPSCDYVVKEGVFRVCAEWRKMTDKNDQSRNVRPVCSPAYDPETGKVVILDTSIEPVIPDILNPLKLW